MFKKMLCLAILTLYITGISCQAAPIPIPDAADAGVTLKRSTDIGEFYKKEKQLYQEKTEANTDNVVNNTNPEPVNGQKDNVYFSISKIHVDKSAILQEEEIRTVTGKYEGKELSLNDLYQAVSEINKLYKNNSYITAKAVLPPQKIENGVVRIQLVEGRFGDFLVEGNKHTRSSYLTDRISMHRGELVKLDQLERDLFYFNSTNDVRMKAELRPGKDFGTTDCVLHIEEPATWQASMFSDNAGSSASGLYRFGMVLANNSLFGNRESLVISPTWTRGTTAGSVSYSFPVNNLGTRLGYSYSKNQVNIISGPYESMDIAADSSDVGISLSHPLNVEAKRKVDGYAEFHRKDSGTDFFGNPLLQSEVNTFTVGINSRTVDDKGLWYSQNSVTRVDASKKDAYAGKLFSRYNVAVIRQQILDNDKMLIWRFSGQLTDDRELPTSEQFSLGGMSSVKGYTEGVFSGDQGYYAGVEYNYPLPGSDKIKGLLFIDHGATYNSYNNGEKNKEFLTSAGFGITLNYSSDIFGKIVVGFPVNSSCEQSGARIHFFLQSSIK